MQLAETLKNKIATYNLLKHPFYQAWMDGTLSKEKLQNYAVQYYPHVKDFPRFVSAVHSRCEDSKARRMLLENLNEEEGFPAGQDHPELWLRFAEGLGLSRSDVLDGKVNQKSQDLVSDFWRLCDSSYAEGLAALYAYEHQIPEIAKLKIEGLKERYSISDERTLAFFAVHEGADKFHSEACAELINQLSEKDAARVLSAATKAASSLWNFLTEVNESCAS